MGLIGKVASVLDRDFREKNTEAEAIRKRHAEQVGILRDQWYRLTRPDGKVVGFSYSCKCGTEWKLLSAFEWLRDYKCSSCGAVFELLRAVKLSGSSPIDELVPALAKLPARPHVAGPDTRQRFVETWAQNADTNYEASDPGASGLF